MIGSIIVYFYFVCGFIILSLYLIRIFIKSAVKKAIKEALQDSSNQTLLKEILKTDNEIEIEDKSTQNKDVAD